MSKLKKIFTTYKDTSVFYSVLVTIVIITVIVLELYFFIPLHNNINGGQNVAEIYFAANISPAHKKLIDKFNKINSGKIQVIPIDLSFKTFSTNERKELLTRSLRSKSDRMDIMEVDVIWVKRFAKWCLPLGEYFSKEERADFLPEAIASCYYNDTIFVALPYYFDIGILFYRDDLLKKFPHYKVLKTKLDSSITWKEFIKLSKEIKNYKNPFYIFSAEDYEGLVCSYVELVLSQDRNFFNEHNFDLTLPESEKALNTLVNFVKKEKISPPAVTNFNENNGYEYFLKNDGIFFRGWPNFSKDSKNLYQDSSKTKHLVKAALPHFAGTKPAYTIGGWNLMVSKYTSKKKEIVKFLKFIVSEESQKIHYEKDGYLPVLKKFYEDPHYLKKFPELNYIKYLQKYGVHRPLLEYYTRISDIISHYIRKAIKGEITTKTALKEATNLIRSNRTIF